MAAEEEILLEIKIDRAGAQKATADFTKQITALTEETKRLTEQNKKLDTSTKEGAAQLNKNNVEIAKNRQQIGELRKEQQLNIKTLQQEDHSLNALRTNLIKLKRERDNINTSTEEGKKRFKELTVEIKDTTDTIKEQEEAGGDFRRSVGNYGAALSQAGGSAGQLGKGLQIASQGIGDVTKSALKFLATPLGLILTAVAIALKAVSNALTRTEKGVKIMHAITATFEGVLITVESVLTKIGEAMITAFEDPVGSIKALWEAIKTNIVNRFTGLFEFFVDLGDVIGNALSGNFDKAGEAAKRAGQNFIQMHTGLDEAQQSGIVDFFEDVADKVNAASEASLKLVEAQERLRAESREAGKRIALLERELELQTQIADSATLGLEQRARAAEKVSDLIQKKANEELNLAKQAEEIAKLELDLIKQRGDTAGDALDDAKDALAEAQKARIEAESQYTITVRANEEMRRQLRQDTLEKDLDILLDGFDNVKSINEQLIADTELTFQRRREILDETKALADKSFEEQTKTIQKFSEQAIDFNDLLATSDAKVLNEKIRGLGLSEKIEGRLLEVIRERRTVNQDLQTTERELSQAFQERLLREQEGIDALENFRKEVEINKTTNQRKSIQKQIELEEQLLNQQLENQRFLLESEKLTEEERLLLVEQTEERIRQLNQQRIENTQETFDRNAEVVAEGVSVISDIIGADQENRLKENEEFKQRELEKIDQAEKQGLIDAKEADKKRLALDKETAKKAEEIERQKFIKNKIQRLIQGTIDTASAVIAALAGPPPPPASIPFAIAAGAFGAAQLGIIAAQQFAEGGEVGRSLNIGGRRHSEGGTLFVGSDGTRFEAEKGEKMFVMKRSASAAIDALSNWNQLFGGRSFGGSGVRFAQEGGNISTTQATNTLSLENQAAFASNVADAIADIQPIVLVDDIRTGVSNVVQVEELATK